jgi:hypothetical protein
MLVSYILVEESAHRVGRALHELGRTALTNQVTAELRAELRAVEQAELGDLSGRGQQAVVLTRADASPAQVAAADRLLHKDPLGSSALMSDLDPTAAAVAAAHWLDASAAVAAEAQYEELMAAFIEAVRVEAAERHDRLL